MIQCSSMALNRRILVQRLFNLSRTSGLALTNSCAFTPHTVAKNSSFNRDGVFRRYFHHLAAATNREQRLLPGGENSTLRGTVTEGRPPEMRLTVADVRKVLRISQIETVKSRLREIDKGRVSYTEFLQICVKECLNIDQGLEVAKTLDESGCVIVIGNTVFLRPQQLVKAVQGRIPSPSAHNCGADSRTKELEEMEKHKAAIDKNTETMVRSELWCGLGFLVIQTAVFMRLTFWDLTWDVMEPICFYVTSFYFIGGYTFFLRTSTEPSFEGFFQSRFRSKQRRLMRVENFDVDRYDELKKGCYLD